jgi:hypothetical protein
MAVTTGSALSRERSKDAPRPKATGNQLVVLVHAWFFGASAVSVNPRRIAGALSRCGAAAPGGAAGSGKPSQFVPDLRRADCVLRWSSAK